MSVLAFKAIGYGAEQIPDKLFEKIPGGFFKPGEEKTKDKNSRSPSEEKSTRNSQRSRRERSAHNDDSDHSGSDTEYEKEQRRKERRRRKSSGRSTSRSSSRGRGNQRSRDRDTEHSNRDMAYAEQGQGQGPYFPPPPTSEHRPYDSQEHASRQSQEEYRSTSTQPQYGYPTQVNIPFRSRSATVPMMASYPTPVNSCPPMLLNRPPSNAPSPFAALQPHFFDHLRNGTPVSASFSPSYEPPLAAILRRPPTNTPQPGYGQTFPSQTPVNRRDGTSPPAVAYGSEAAHRYEEIQRAKAGQQQQPRSGSAARYMPGPGYAPSPAVMPAAPIPPPPVGVNSPPAGASAPYAPYNPATYAPSNPGYPPAGSDYASPPQFYRQQSRSQPSFDQDQHQSSYNPRSSDQQVAPYDDRHSPSRRSSTKHDRREHRHRARSVDSRNSRHESSRMSDMRERFDDIDLRTKNLGATVAGALAGGFAGRAAGKSRLTMLAGAAAGALGGQAIAARNVDRYAILMARRTIMSLHTTGPRTNMADSLRARARVQGTESMVTVIAAGKRRAVEGSELEVEVLLIASAQSLEEETTVTIVADAMSATGLTTAIAITTVMIVADAVIEAETVDVRTMDIRSTRSTTTSPSLILRVKDHPSCSAGRRPRREETTRHEMMDGEKSCYQSLVD